MCWNNRVIYSCGHDRWGIQIRACEVQKAFDNGTDQTECDTMNSHPLHCRKVSPVCKKCSKKTSRLNSRIGAAKLMMKEVNETVERLRSPPTATKLDQTDKTMQTPQYRLSTGESPPVLAKKEHKNLDWYEKKFMEQMKEMVANIPTSASEPLILSDSDA